LPFIDNSQYYFLKINKKYIVGKKIIKIYIIKDLYLIFFIGVKNSHL